MDGSLYDEDYYTWAKRQAAALRALSTRAPSNEVDWANLIEEVEDLGKNVVRAVQSALVRLMEHAALLALAPDDHRDRVHWLVEMAAFRDQAVDDYAPSMRQILTPRLDRDWGTARRRAAAKLDLDPALLPEKRPFTLAELIHALPIDDLPRRLRHATTPVEEQP
jgi:hypothetical protein